MLVNYFDLRRWITFHVLLHEQMWYVTIIYIYIRIYVDVYFEYIASLFYCFQHDNGSCFILIQILYTCSVASQNNQLRWTRSGTCQISLWYVRYVWCNIWQKGRITDCTCQYLISIFEFPVEKEKEKDPNPSFGAFRSSKKWFTSAFQEVAIRFDSTTGIRLFEWP